MGSRSDPVRDRVSDYGSHLMAQARDLGVPTPEVLGVEHLEHDGEVLSFSIHQFLPGRSLDQFVGELPLGDFEGAVLAAVHQRDQVGFLLPGGELVGDRASVGQGPSQAVELGDHEGVAGAAGSEGLTKSGSFAVGAGQAVVDVDAFGLDAEAEQGIALGGEVLLIGGRRAEPDPTSDRPSFPICKCRDPPASSAAQVFVIRY